MRQGIAADMYVAGTGIARVDIRRYKMLLRPVRLSHLHFLLKRLLDAY